MRIKEHENVFWAFSPSGKEWRFDKDLNKYLALARTNELLCCHGHFGCAAWADGPCTDELSHVHGVTDE